MKIEIHFDETDNKESLMDKFERGLKTRIGFRTDESKQFTSIEGKGIQITNNEGQALKITKQGIEIYEKSRDVQLNDFDMLSPEELETYNHFINEGFKHEDAMKGI